MLVFENGLGDLHGRITAQRKKGKLFDETVIIDWFIQVNTKKEILNQGRYYNMNYFCCETSCFSRLVFCILEEFCIVT